MTTISPLSSLSSLLPTYPVKPATAVATQPSAATPASTIVSLSQVGNAASNSTDGLQSMQPPVTNTVSWEKKSNDAVTSQMTVNFASPALSDRFKNLGSALLKQLGTDGSDFSQSVFQSTATKSDAAIDIAATDSVSKAMLHSDVVSNQITLDIKTADGIKVSLTLGSQDNGVAVQVKTEGKLSDADKGALAKLANAFQSAVDGISSVPPKLDLTGLTQFNSQVLSSIDLHAKIQLGGSKPQTLDFHADGTQRSVIADGPGGTVTVNVDLHKLAALGSSQQRAEAMSAYLKQFDQVGDRGNADPGMLSMFKDAFQQMNSSLPASSNFQTNSISLSDSDHAILTGLADFDASITATPNSPNPMRPGEHDTFSYQVSQDTEISGGSLNRSISQKQHSHLEASYHEPISADMPLALDGSKESQNYIFKQISEDSTSDAEISYKDGELAKAAVHQSTTQNIRESRYAMAQLVEETSHPVSVELNRDFLGMIQHLDKTAERTPQDITQRQQALATIHNSVFLQSDPILLRSEGGLDKRAVAVTAKAQ